MTIPRQIRQELGFEPGTSVVAYVDEGRLVLESREHLAARIQREATAPLRRGGSVVDELIAERRAEAAREEGGEQP